MSLSISGQTLTHFPPSAMAGFLLFRPMASAASSRHLRDPRRNLQILGFSQGISIEPGGSVCNRSAHIGYLLGGGRPLLPTHPSAIGLQWFDFEVDPAHLLAFGELDLIDLSSNQQNSNHPPQLPLSSSQSSNFNPSQVCTLNR